MVSRTTSRTVLPFGVHTPRMAARPHTGGAKRMSMVLDVRPEAGQSFTLRPLSPALAAEVIGLDLRQPLDAATRDAVYAAFVRHHVLCFRDQALNKDQQIAFTQQFGTLERHIASNRGADNPLVHTVSNLD